MTIPPDPTSKLTRAAAPVIVLAANRDEFEQRMIAYGMDADDPFIYPCYDATTAHDVSLSLPDDTPWCKTNGNVSEAGARYLQQVYGPAVTMAEALNVQHNDVAINPKLLT